mmetsp:Transcript_27163/g.40119  ORF Transcript_27163/g.40119 Transcript_27163/m.40119 type:complete len:109 (-) Transcript_27163:215-541(-)
MLAKVLLFIICIGVVSGMDFGGSNLGHFERQRRLILEEEARKMDKKIEKGEIVVTNRRMLGNEDSDSKIKVVSNKQRRKKSKKVEEPLDDLASPSFFFRPSFFVPYTP